MNKLTVAAIKEELAKVTDKEDPLISKYAQDERSSVRLAVEQRLRQLDKQIKLYEDHLQRLTFERELIKEGMKYIAGIDEVGRGPLAGPVVTAAVILPSNCEQLLVGVTDSKQLSHEKRQYFAEQIKEVALAYQIITYTPQQIDTLNIYEATRSAMTEAVNKLSIQPEYLLIDAMTLAVDIPQMSLVKGDQRSLTIAAASILAKVHRDQLMMAYAQEYPDYGFERNMGYGTAEHLQALKRLGPTPIHRRSFEPIKSMV